MEEKYQEVLSKIKKADSIVIGASNGLACPERRLLDIGTPLRCSTLLGHALLLFPYRERPPHIWRGGRGISRRPSGAPRGGSHCG